MVPQISGRRNALNFKEALLEADQEYRDHAAILSMAGAPDIVLLPRAEIQFATDQPDTVLNMHVKATETLQIDYTCPAPSLVHNPIHHKLIVITLTNQTGNLVPDVADETSAPLRGTGAPTRPPSAKRASTTRCATSSATMAFTHALALSSHLLRFVWEPLRPLAALVLTLPNRIHARRHGRILLQDDAVYADAGSFRPFRSAEQRGDESVAYLERAAKAFATTGTDYLAFGYDRNACSGRFFAASELKIMLAHVLLYYGLEMQPARTTSESASHPATHGGHHPRQKAGVMGTVA
ncbi:hypothetical protein B0T26DRAFT_768869 [Lasiosphaeria miniovina]|uniref:Uncharacterized protein n=1 Tax=Lasiosphaeria miniovina TaxID=1954250 RepID=A0AA40B710_9PEZI|nr:uncharacterized protein B0T26DRAFT_768869 [Lasiosphaeria miniovina]KAK0728849.1 hypothetical protein B0T26DRAFT_768869 [Lasiosphaeria miniovina]